MLGWLSARSRFLSKLSGGFNEIVGLIVANQVLAMASLIVLGTCTDKHFFAEIVFVMAFSGFVSGISCSNNTSLIFVSISEKESDSHVAGIARILFAYEQAFTLILCIFAGVYLHWINGASFNRVLILTACALMTSNSSMLAICKMKDSVFVRLQYMTIISTLCKLTLLLLSYFLLSIHFVSVAIFASLAFQYVASIILYTGLPGRKDNRMKFISQNMGENKPLLISQYVIGVPIAVIRSASQAGVLLWSTFVLDANSVRTFRFLYMPRQYIGRLFGMLLPVTFNRIYGMRGNHLFLVGSAAIGAVLFCCFYFSLAVFFPGLNGSAATIYTIWGGAVGLTYAFSSYQWNDVYIGKHHLNLMAITPGFFALLGYYFLAVENAASVNSMIAGLLLYYLCYCIVRGGIQLRRSLV